MRHLKIYRAIREIRQQGSIRQAAHMLSVSPSALNRSIQAFEDEFGFPIFDRISGGVELSAAGELLVTLVEQHLIEFVELQSQMRNLRDGLTGEVAVSMGEDINNGLLLDALGKFEDEFPSVSLSLETANSAEALKQRKVDLAILTNPETDDGTEVLYSQMIPITTWFGPGLKEIDGIWDLVDERLILPPEGTGTRAAFRHILRRHRLEERTVTSASASLMNVMLLSGHRFGVAPAISVRANQPPMGYPRSSRVVGEVQVSIVRASGVPMKKSAEALSLRLQRELEQENTPQFS